MLKYAKVVNSQTKQCEVGIGTNELFYQSIGMKETDVEQAYDGVWYLTGYVPAAPKKTYVEKRTEAYPPISEQLDMIYWDKVNNTTAWRDKITEIKNKYPKE